MALTSKYRGNLRFWLKGYIFLGVALMILAMLIYSNHLIARMQEQSDTTSRLFARYFGNVIFEVSDDGSLAGLREVLHESNLPIIVTVLDGRPILWTRVDIGQEDREGFGMAEDHPIERDLQALLSIDVENPPTRRLRKLVKLYREFDKVNTPVPVRVLGVDKPQGYVHYGESPLQRELRMMPFIQLGIFLVFMGVAIQGLRYLKLSEERSIWVGMAKETAHQLGTPLSALLGWAHLLKDRAERRGDQEMVASINEMEIDIGRLNKVAMRFGKIGSQPELKAVELTPVLERSVAYFHRRLPRLNANSTISLDAKDDVVINGNEELLEWVFENLIKNGLDAMDDGGKITITSRQDERKKHVDVFVKDTGRGIPQSLRGRIFRPGYTTKRRGWGLGLALTRRIVEDYHDGSIRVVESRPGKGTTFQIRLPVA